MGLGKVALPEGFAPTTFRFEAGCSESAELREPDGKWCAVTVPPRRLRNVGAAICY